MPVLSLLMLQASAAPGGALLQFLPIILIFGIFYFLLFLPMQRQKKKQQQMLRELKNGDAVMTNGGLIGMIVAVNDDDSLFVRVKPDNIKVHVARSAVASVLNPESKAK